MIVARVAESPTTVNRLAHRVARTFRLVIDEVEIVVVPRVEVPADNIPAFVFAEVKLVVEIFVDVEFVIVASDKFAVPAAIVAVASVAVPRVATPPFIAALAIVVVASADVPVAVKFVVAKLLVVAFVIVAFSAVNPSTASVLAHSVPRTFNQVIDEEETEVVAKVEVPVEVIVVRFAFVPEILVTVALVIVASNKLALPEFIVAAAIVVVARDVVPVFVNTPVVVE